MLGFYGKDAFDIEPDEKFFEVCPDEGILETAGYMDTEKLVNQLLRAGENLAIFREAEFPGDELVPDDAPANRMMDRMDAIRESRMLRKRMREELDGNIGRDTAGGGRSGNVGTEHVEPKSGKPEERKPDEGELAKG